MIEFEVLDRVAVITICRPDARNAVNGEVASGIETAIDRLEGDRDLWVGILAGQGPVFSAGDGPALAGGCELALACDLIVASRRAVFGVPEVKRSLVASAGGLFRLPRAL